MNEERRKQQILHILAAGIRKVMEEAHLDYGKLQEIRLRTDQPLLILYQGEELFLPAGRAKKHMVTKEEIKETLEYSSHYSLYAYENEIRQGFLTVEGGHRVGVAGKAILEQEKVKSLQHISSVNIRMCGQAASDDHKEQRGMSYTDHLSAMWWKDNADPGFDPADFRRECACERMHGRGCG